MKRFFATPALLVCAPFFLMLTLEAQPGYGSAKPVTLDVSIRGSADFREAFSRVKNAFEQEYPYVKVDLSGSGTGNKYHDALMTRILGGTPPDVAEVNDFAFAGFVGVLEDLTPYVKRTWAFGEPGYAHFFPHTVQTFQYKGGQYGIPSAINPIGIVYNMEMFDRAGLVQPVELYQRNNWTWDTFLEAAKKLTRGEIGDPNRVNGFAGGTSVWDVAMRIWQNGGSFFNEDKTVVTIQEPPAVEAIQWFFDLANVHNVSLPFDRAQPMASFTKGTVAMIDGGLANRRQFETSCSFEWDVAPQPSRVRSAHWASGFGWSIPKTSRHKDEAWKWIEFVSRPAIARETLRMGTPAGAAVVKALASNVVLYQPPKHPEMWLEAAKHGFPPPWIRSSQFQSIVEKELKAVARGETPARSAALNIQKQVQPLLGE